MVSETKGGYTKDEKRADAILRKLDKDARDGSMSLVTLIHVTCRPTASKDSTN